MTKKDFLDVDCKDKTQVSMGTPTVTVAAEGLELCEL